MDQPVGILSSLSAKELEVLRMVAQGMAIDAIAQRLGRSRKTVQTHRLSLGHKLGARNRVELTHLAIKAGLISLPGSAAPVSAPAPALTSGTPALTLTANHAVTLCDSRTRVRMVNGPFVQLMGSDRAQPLVGRLMQDFFADPDQARRLARQLLEMRSWMGLVELARLDGTAVRVNLWASQLTDHNDRPSGILACYAHPHAAAATGNAVPAPTPADDAA